MALFNLIAKLGLNSFGFESGLNRAERTASQFAGRVGSNIKGQLAAAFGFGAIIQMTRNTVEYAGKINDMSQRLGVSTDFLQEQGYALKQNGAEMEALVPIMEKLTKAREAALAEPTGAEAADFKRLGVSPRDLRTSNLEGIYMRIGSAIQKAVNPQEKLVSAMRVMGRSSGVVFPAMRSGLRDAAKDAHALGQVIETSVIRTLDDVGDKIDEIMGRMRTTTATALLQLLQWIENIAQRVQWVGTYMGSRTAGIPIEESVNIADRQLLGQATQSQVRAVARKRHRARPIEPLDFEALTKTSTERGISSARALESIGAFVNINPLIQEQKRTNQFLRDIHQNTKKLDRLNQESIDDFQ